MIIQRLTNFVPRNDLEQIYHQLTSTQEWILHDLSWRYYLFEGLKPYNQRDPDTWYGNQPGILEQLTPVWKRLFNSVFDLAGPTFQLMRSSILGQTQNQFPLMHVDVDQDIPGTYRSYLLYLNTTWDNKWGGATVIESKDKTCYQEWPEPGKLVEFDSQIWHTGNPPIEPDIFRIIMVLHGRIY